MDEEELELNPDNLTEKQMKDLNYIQKSILQVFSTFESTKYKNLVNELLLLNPDISLD
jgi:hypothetical protein